MARHILLAITLMGIGAALNSPARAVQDAPLCENTFANCVGGCANRGGGTYVNRCMSACDKRVNKCLIRAHEAFVFGGR
jgi:hypothetical protein